MSKKAWTIDDIPPLSGKLALVTGATGGLGHETALALAKAGATVIVGGRNEEKGKSALENIITLCPDAKVEFGKVDHTSLASIAEFARMLSGKYDSLDILINNAGVSLPTREVTTDGFESTFATNHLSHFALTAQLLPMLRKSSGPRVVTVSSLLHRSGQINFDDLQAEKSYNGGKAYSQSKVANLLFAFELQRRSEAGGWGIVSIAAHPGFSRTPMVTNSSGIQGWLTNYVMLPLASQSAAEGALPQLYAATSPDAQGGAYYGPDGFYEMKGAVAPAYVAPVALDTVVATKLWDVSTSLTGVTWPEV